MNNISPEHSEEILKELLKVVNAKESFEEFDFAKKNWFWDYEWTRGDQDSFIIWLAKFLQKHGYVRGKQQPLHEAGKIVASYGWKIKLTVPTDKR